MSVKSILCNVESSNIKKSMEEKYSFMDKKSQLFKKNL